MNRMILSVVAILALLSGRCANDNTDVQKLNYGTSYGMCIGYCKNEMDLQSGFVTYIHSSWVDTLDTITCIDKLDKSLWEYFSTELNADSFLALPKTIGCPDCADGGAEWVEAELANGEKHKVTFEAGNEPEILSEYVKKLREQMQLSGQCGEY